MASLPHSEATLSEETDGDDAMPRNQARPQARMVDAATPRNVMRGGLPNLDARTVRAMAVVHTQSWGSYPGFVSSGTVSAQSD